MLRVAGTAAVAALAAGVALGSYLYSESIERKKRDDVEIKAIIPSVRYTSLSAHADLQYFHNHELLSRIYVGMI